MKIFSISSARQNLISKIVYPKRKVDIPKLCNTELYDTFLGKQKFFNYMATRYRIGFSFTEVPIYKGCMVTCYKGKMIKSSDYITVNDSNEEIEKKIAAAIYQLVPKE